MDIRTINPIDFKGWDELIAPLPGSSFFHTSAWAKVLSETYKYKPVYFTIFEGNRLIGLLPVMDVKSILTGHRGVSLPFTDFCEPIVEDSAQFHDLFQHAVSYGKQYGWKSFEMRGGENLLPEPSPSQTLLTHILDLLPDEKSMLSRFRDSTRRNIKKAVTEGVTTEILHTIESVKEFYRLNCLTRKEHGLPPQPLRFFEAVHRNIISKGHGFVTLAHFQNKSIAGNIYFHFGNKAIYKYGASDKKYQNLRASNLVMWEGIQWFCGKGYKELHFGRTEHTHQGLRQFKLGWGTKEHSMSYHLYDLGRKVFSEGNHIKVNRYEPLMKMLPLSALRLFGTVMYRHLG